jgi:RNA polymerase sigma factor (sigma-70 family)
MSGEDPGPSPNRSVTVHDEVAGLVRLATDGDQQAWNGLVDRFSSLLWSICRSYNLKTADAEDVFQLTWLRLLEHIGTIEDPARLPGWLATTCRRECLSHLRREKRSQPAADERLIDLLSEHEVAADRTSLVADRNAGLWQAFGRLGERCRQLLRLLIAEAEDGPSYAVTAAALDMPVGSIGPTRARCLEHLRKLLAREGISGVDADS